MRYLKSLSFRPTALSLSVAASLFALGTFHEYLSAVLSAVLAALLLARFRKQGRVVFRPGLVSCILVGLPFLFLLTGFWAADRGMALMGFVKFLPVSLLTVLLSDREPERDGILQMLPLAGALQTVIAALLMQLPALRSFFSVSGRLAGFMQYPNTFALFLLLGALVILTKEKTGAADLVCLAVLVFGILYSGSRTTLVLTAVLAAAAVFTGKSKKTKWAALICVGGLIAAAGIYAAVSGDVRAIGRFVSISLNESTFLGRLLYWKDGLRLALHHPFGLGYLGWQFLQFPNQTGVYRVQFIHNDFLQILLDLGVPGFGLFAAAFCASFFSRRSDRRRRLMLLAFGGHLMMDFDLQFVAMALLLAVLLYLPGKEKEWEITKRAAVAAPCAVLTLFSCWLGLSQGLYHFKRYRAAMLYPGNTQALIARMQETEDAAAAAALADRIVGKNRYVAAAWGVKAAAAFSSGDILTMDDCKRRQIQNAPYEIAAYDEYCYMLAVAFDLYGKQQDAEGMAFCRNRLLQVPEMLSALEKNTDPLAFRIDDKPSFELSEESRSFIAQIGQAVP